MEIRLAVNIGKLKLKNPVMVASGTFGYAEEFKDFLDLKQLGAIVTKTITLKPRKGNPGPRTCETPSGLLNSIGLENPGVDKFIKERLTVIKKAGVPVIVSIASEGGFEEFVLLARKLDRVKEVSAIELNISCPNIREKSRLISQDASATYDLVKSVRKVTQKTLITKLSPNVTSVADIARAAENAGSDALSLINTLTGMSIDVDTRRPKIASIVAGLSGPAIKPVAVRMVWEVYKQVKIPIIGMGGIMNTEDALEFLIAGASAVSIGTGNFINPEASVEIIGGLKKYMAKLKINDIKDIVGSLKI